MCATKIVNITDIAILVSDRLFVKIVNGEEIDVKAEELAVGDAFAVYSGPDKLVKCHWDSIFEFVCNGSVFKNEEDVAYIPCKVVELE
jgi:hypothetical protein